MELSAPTGLLLSRVPDARVQDLIDTNKLLRKAKSRQHQTMTIHTLNPEEIVTATWANAAHANRPDLSSTKGVIVVCTEQTVLEGKLVPLNPIYWSASNISRVCRSSASAETRAAVDGEDMMYSVRFQLAEFKGYHANVWNPDETVNHIPGVLVSDSKNLFDRLNSTLLTVTGAERRSDIESLCLKEAMTENYVILRWVNGESQLANSLAKENEPHQLQPFGNRNGRWRIVYDETLMSGRKRKQLGLDALEQYENDVG